MDKKIILLIVLGVVVAGIILTTIFMNVYVPSTGYAVKNVSDTVKETPAEQPKIVEEPAITGPVRLSLSKGNDITLGYMPKELILNNLQAGVTIKLGIVELTIGSFSDTALVVALREQSISNIRLSDGVIGNYKTSDGELEFLYENYVLYVKRLTNPNNYPDAK